MEDFQCQNSFSHTISKVHLHMPVNLNIHDLERINKHKEHKEYKEHKQIQTA